MKKKTLLVLISALMISIFVGCTVSSGTARIMTEKNNSHCISATYDKYDGYKKTTLKVKADEEKDVNVSIVSNEGEIDLKITQEDGTVVYQGDNIDTSSFVVTLDKEGKYTIRIDAKDHSGSYDINW